MNTIRIHVDDFSEEKVKELLELGVLEEWCVAHMLQQEEQVCIEGDWIDILGHETIWCFNLKEVKKHIDKVISGNGSIVVKKIPKSCKIELCNSIYPLVDVVYRDCYLCREVINDKEISVLDSNLKIPNQLKITIG